MALKITIIGSGNVGYHLAKRLFSCGYQIRQVYSRTLSQATLVANLTNSEAVTDLSLLALDADIYILATKDDALKKLAEEITFLNKYNKIIAHTSGSVSSNIFEGLFDHYGVFYPLQTFSIQKEPNFEQLPFCIFGNTAETQKQLEELAKSICPNVYLINDQQRAVLHVSAVIVNNFSNYLYGIAHEICQDQQVSFDILKPLIAETVNKINLHAPIDVQTGPAARGDVSTMEKHLDFLEQYPEYQAVYKLMSAGIVNWKHPNNVSLT